MALVSLEDPGLTVFGNHRLLSNLAANAPREALRDAILAHFDVEEVPLEHLDPAGEEGIGVFGYVDAHHRKGYRLRLKDPAPLEVAIPGVSAAYRELDAAILEALILRGALGMSAEDIEAKRGIAYAASAERGARGPRRRRRRGLPDAPDAGRAGARRRGGRRDDAAEVDLLLPEGPHGRSSSTRSARDERVTSAR